MEQTLVQKLDEVRFFTILELVEYPQEYQKKFWDIFNRDLPKIFKTWGDVGNENILECELELLCCVDSDKTVNEGVFSE